MRARLYVIRDVRYTLVILHGDLTARSGDQGIDDQGSEPDLIAQLKRVIDQAAGARSAAVIVDMCGVSSCEPSIARALVGCAGYAAGQGVRFALAWLLPPIAELFHRGPADQADQQADQIVAVYPDVRAAVRALVPGATPGATGRDETQA